MITLIPKYSFLMLCSPNWGRSDWHSGRDNEVHSLKGLLHVGNHPGSHPLGLHKLLSFEALGDAQGHSDIGSHLPFQAGHLQGLQLTGCCFAAKGVHVCHASCIQFRDADGHNLQRLGRVQ